MGKECMARLSRRLWGGTSLKTAAKEATFLLVFKYMIFFVVYMSSKRPLGRPLGNTPDKPPQKSRRSQRRETAWRKSLLFSQDVDENGIYTVFLENLSTKQGIFKPL